MQLWDRKHRPRNNQIDVAIVINTPLFARFSMNLSECYLVTYEHVDRLIGFDVLFDAYKKFQF